MTVINRNQANILHMFLRATLPWMSYLMEHHSIDVDVIRFIQRFEDQGGISEDTQSPSP
jgi:hypothetical protein